VRVSGRAKRIAIKVYPRGRVEVVAPKRASAKDVEAFVREHSDWIAQTRRSFAAEIPAEPFELPKTLELRSCGLSLRVFYQSKPHPVRIRRHGDVLAVRGQIDDEQACVAALIRWLKKFAKREFEPTLWRLSEWTGNSFERLQIRAQKTCWGSHSSTGTITMNYSLLFLAPELVRYLMIHELCHARHMNHSKAYWKHVECFEPRYRELDQRLTESWKDVPVWLGMH